jgi:hypothetical protein
MSPEHHTIKRRRGSLYHHIQHDTWWPSKASPSTEPAGVHFHSILLWGLLFGTSHLFRGPSLNKPKPPTLTARQLARWPAARTSVAAGPMAGRQ